MSEVLRTVMEEHRYVQASKPFIVLCTCGWTADRRNSGKDKRGVHEDHVLTVLAKTHEVVELPKPAVRTVSEVWWDEGDDDMVVHCYLRSDVSGDVSGDGVGYYDREELTVAQMRERAAVLLACARVAQGGVR